MSMSMSMSIYTAHKRETSNALYALVRSKHKRFQMLPKCISANSRITQVVRQRVSHRRTSHQCLAGSMERPGVVCWQIEVVAVMWRWRPYGRNLSGTVELGRACSWTSWHSACRRLAQVSIEPVQLGVQEPRQATVRLLVCTADHSSCGVQHSLLSLLSLRPLRQRCSSRCVTL